MDLLRNVLVGAILLTAATSTTSCLFLPDSIGFTYPIGDIVLEVGQPLEIFCILTNSKYRAEDLMFKTKSPVDSSYVTIVNETTARLLMPNMTAQRSTFHCSVKDSSSRGGQRGVCLNVVVIGTKPNPVTRFNCSSLNWNGLKCDWTPTPNYLKTNHTSAYSYDNRTWEDCRNTTKLSCILDPGDRRLIYFRLNIGNTLGNISQYFTVDVYKNVLAVDQPIVNLTKIDSGVQSMTLGWFWPSWSHRFPPGLVAKICYKTQLDPKDFWHEIVVANSSGLDGRKSNELVIVKLNDLEYANTIYDIRIYVKSAVADDTGWSVPEVTTMRTLPTIPGAAPEVDIGSFKTDIEHLDKRRIIVYWRQIPEHLENGDNFGYTVQVYENSTLINKKPDSLTRTMAKFTNLYTMAFYTFRIYSTNIVGNSSEYAEITVPPSHLLPPEPEEESFVKIAYGDGMYELQWAPPHNTHTPHIIRSYTIFWCQHKKRECTGSLNWTRVASDVLSINISLVDNKDFQFLISANTDHSSSGMIWASCSVLKNRVPDVNSVSDITVNRLGSDFIELSWMLDCSSRIGAVIEYVIYYCPIVLTKSENCKEPERKKIVSEPKDLHKESTNRMAYNVTGLRPYTTYKLAIALRTDKVPSKRSHEELHSTLEAAPDNPPGNVTVTEVTNTTITVTWSAPAPLNGMLREYIVYWGHLHTTVKHDEKIELTDLESLTDYNISVSACTVACSPKSQPINVKTKIGNPSQVMYVKTEHIEANKITVSWAEAENISRNPGGPTAENHYYEVMVELHHESLTIIVQQPQIEITNGTQLEIDVSKCEYVSHIMVRAVNVDANNHTYPGPWSPPNKIVCTKPGVTWIILFLIFLALLLFLPLLFRWSYRFFQSIICIEIKMPPPLVVRNMAKDKEMDTPLEAHIHQPRPHLFVHNNTLFPSDFPATDQLIHLMMDSRNKSSNGVADSLPQRSASFNNNNMSSNSRRKKRASSEELLKGSQSGATTTPEEDSRSLNDFVFDYPPGASCNSVDLSVESEEDYDEEQVTHETEVNSDSAAGHYSVMAPAPVLTPQLQQHPSFSNISSVSSVESEGGSDACLLRQRNVAASAGGGYCQMAVLESAAPGAAVAQQQFPAPAPAPRGYVMQAPPWSTKQPSPHHHQPPVQPHPPTAAYCVIGIKHPPSNPTPH